MSEKRRLRLRINKAMLAITKQQLDRVGEQGHLPFTDEEVETYNFLGELRELLEKIPDEATYLVRQVLDGMQRNQNALTTV